MDARKTGVLSVGVALCALGLRLWSQDAPDRAPRPLREPADLVSGEDATVRPVVAQVAAATPRAPRVHATVEPLPVLACELSRSLVGLQLAELVDQQLGRPLAWRIRSRDRLGEGVQRGAAPLAVLADRAGVDALGGLDTVELGDLVLVVVAPRRVQPGVLPTARLRRLLQGRYASWRRVAGPDVPVEPFGFAGTDAGTVSRLLGVVPAGTATDREPRALLQRLTRSRGGVAVLDLRSLERLRIGFPVDDLSVAVDGVAPSHANFRSGHYPYGVALRVVAAPDASDAVRQLLVALRGLGRRHPLTARLSRP